MPGLRVRTHGVRPSQRIVRGGDSVSDRSVYSVEDVYSAIRDLLGDMSVEPDFDTPITSAATAYTRSWVYRTALAWDSAIG